MAQGGEGLTAINFAKIGAYTVAGRQSNPSSAHYPPYAEMGVQLDGGSSLEKRRAVLLAIPACTFCNYLPGTQNSFSLFQPVFSLFLSLRYLHTFLLRLVVTLRNIFSAMQTRA